MNFTEEEILYKFDLAFEGQPDGDFPIGGKGATRYNSFLDLEHGYFETAGNKIHLYADSTRWAVVFEKCGYDNRGLRAEIELDYVGNCINYPTHEFEGTTYITNSKNIVLVTYDEYERVRNKEEKGIADFELISPTATELLIHGQKAKIEHDIKKYLALGIKPSDYKNPNNLIGYADIIRFFSDTEPELVSATEEEIKEHLPIDIPKLMTLDKFHFVSYYSRDDSPSSQETYQLIAKILTTKDTTLWRPKLKPNNHWTNWESGNL